MGLRNLVVTATGLLGLFCLPLNADSLKSNPDSCRENSNTSSLDRSKSSSCNKHQFKLENSVYKANVDLQFIGPRIIAKFAPKNSQGERIALDKLATNLDYNHFNWVSYVEKDPYGIADRTGKILSTPYNDPPAGGYQYESADELPFYWDLVNCDRCLPRHNYQHPLVTQPFELVFEDVPTDYRLKPGEAIEFVTHLVGVKHYDPNTNQAEWDILNTFKWKLSNQAPQLSTVSLIEADLDITRLSPFLLIEMQADGAILPSASEQAGRQPFSENN